MATHPTSRPRLSVGFILANRFTLSAFATFVDVLRLAADDADRSRQLLCSWRVLSHDMRPVTASCGSSVSADERLGRPDRFDYLVVVGGVLGDFEQIDPVYEQYLRDAATDGVALIGLCTGGFILHRAGLMDGYECCVSWFHHDDFLEHFDGLIPVSDKIFVIDRDRMTCSGGVSSVHLAAHLVERHVGLPQVRKSLHILGVDKEQSGETAQPGMPVALRSQDMLVRRALILMQQSISTPKPVSVLCRQLGVTRRTLERRFQASLTVSPAEADRIMRLEHAEHLIRDRGLSVTAAAAECGFCDASHFAKLYKRHRNVAPRSLTR